MIYHGFYNEEIDWIGFATKQGVEDVKGTGIKINTGVYLPSFNARHELREAIDLAKSNGAKGITFFDGPALNPGFIAEIRKAKESFK